MTPSVLEDFCDKEAVCRYRSSTQIVEAAHQGCRTGLYTSLKRRKVCVPKSLVRNFCIDIIHTCFRCRIACEVLEAGCNPVLLRHVVSLITLDGSLTEYGVCIYIFSISFHHTAPAWVTRNVHHRRECPVDTA